MCICWTAVANAQGPEQVHISFGYQPSEMIVMWSTADYGDSLVLYGRDQFHLNSKSNGSCWKFTYGNPDGLQYMHRVLLEVASYVYIHQSNYVLSRDWSQVQSIGIMWRPQEIPVICSTLPACPVV